MTHEIEEKVTLWTSLRESFVCGGHRWTAPGFHAVAVYRLGVWRMSIRARMVRIPFTLLYRAMFVFVRNFYGIELPHTARIGRRLTVEHQSGIVIGPHTVIGNDCVLRQGVTLGVRGVGRGEAYPCLGNRVDVGAGAKILGGINIGDDASIGANAVVLNDVPKGYTAVGIPARIFPRRSGVGVAAADLSE